MREEHRTGLQYLDAATALLQRVRSADATAGLLEAADLQWWWRSARSTDSLRQLFWFDDTGRPEAAVIATDWGDAVALDPILMPGAPPGWVAHVVGRGLAHASACGLESVVFVVDRADDVMREALVGLGFGAADGAAAASLSVATAWLAAAARPETRTLPPGYRLCSRLDTRPAPHHLVPRNGADVEARLRQTSLYRPEFDLLVLDSDERVAAYGLFWLDPATATGLVEPMRTEGGQQRRGLARHLLGAGIGRLAAAGATRIKLCYGPDNGAARSLYLGAGFATDKQTVAFARRAAA